MLAPTRRVFSIRPWVLVGLYAFWLAAPSFAMVLGRTYSRGLYRDLSLCVAALGLAILYLQFVSVVRTFGTASGLD